MRFWSVSPEGEFQSNGLEVFLLFFPFLKEQMFSWERDI